MTGPLSFAITAEQEALEGGLPPRLRCPSTPPRPITACLPLKGESVESVGAVVEGAVGAWARNEYFEMNVDGLTPSL